MWALRDLFRANEATSLVWYRSGALNQILRNDEADRLTPEDIMPWLPVAETIATHVKEYCDVMVAGTFLPSPSFWATFAAMDAYHEDNPCNVFWTPVTDSELLQFGYAGYSDLNSSWATMGPLVKGKEGSLAVFDIRAGGFLGVVPGAIRYGGVMRGKYIAGPGLLWLDMEGTQGPLASIQTTINTSLINVVTGWEEDQPDMDVPDTKIPRVLAFAARDIVCFQ